MNEKQKPFAAIYIRKPQLSRLVSAILILLISAVAFGLGLREYQRWQSKMQETQALLRERTSKLDEANNQLQGIEALLQQSENALFETSARIHALESELQRSQDSLLSAEEQLQQAEIDLEEYHLFWRQLNEPLGFVVSHYHGLSVSATTCVRIPQAYREQASVRDSGYIFQYTIANPGGIKALTNSDNFRLVGEDKLSAEWTSPDRYSDEYYTHKDVFKLYPYEWSTKKDWIDNSIDWEDLLWRFCKNTIVYH